MQAKNDGEAEEARIGRVGAQNMEQQHSVQNHQEDMRLQRERWSAPV